jgi:transcriptional regulator with XRE-family HTH domain
MVEIGAKLRQARRIQKLSLRDLAAKVDVSASLLSQIENNRANPSVSTLYLIAEALSLPMDYFFSDTQPVSARSEADRVIEKTASEVRHQRVDSPQAVSQDIFHESETAVTGPVVTQATRPTIELLGGVSWSRLTREPEEGTEFLEIVYSVGAMSGQRMSHHSGREFGLVLEGTLLLELGFEVYELGPGDSIIFDSSNPHRLSNNGDQPVRAFWVVMDRNQ